MKGALDIHHELLARDVPHEIVRLPRVVLQADEIPDALGLAPAQCLALRMYVADGELVAVGVPAGSTPDPAALLAALGARSLRPATAQEVNARTEFAAGLVSPVLLPDDVPLYVDAAVGLRDVLYAPTGDTGTALGIRTGDLLMASGARVADLSETPLPPLTEIVLNADR
jgi:prolyl-tRNA editing enzyme YbaK/EbsC (Cys-tRNA(Pro) deacylase)